MEENNSGDDAPAAIRVAPSPVERKIRTRRDLVLEIQVFSLLIAMDLVACVVAKYLPAMSSGILKYSEIILRAGTNLIFHV